MKTKALSLVLAAVLLVALSSAAFAQVDKGYFMGCTNHRCGIKFS